jgi:hypothetical protein
MNNILIKLCFLLVCFQLSSGKWIKPRRLNILSRSQNPIRDARCKQFRTFTQKVDHFGFANMDTYLQRYTLNVDHWESGKPIFFYAGNEGLIDHFYKSFILIFYSQVILIFSVIIRVLVS